MKAVFVLFDTLMKDVLTDYNKNSCVKTPNFNRLCQLSIQFENFYTGSLPCMPARREIHTGRYNFLHRSWGPLEPFDFSAVELLTNSQVYTHLVTDHSHYFEDGGATYHNRYTTWEGFRGQEGDRFLPTLNYDSLPERPKTSKKGYSVKQHYVNRQVQQQEQDYSSVKTVQAGIDFLNASHDNDNWFLQIECFDPHEPFYAPERFRKMYTDKPREQGFDWPAYKPLTENEEELADIRAEYYALVSMCDEYLGKILDVFDEHNLWKDTMLMVGTDHGLLIGEHNWLGKNVSPMYNEIANTPFYMYLPDYKGEKTSNLLAQTIDIAPTLLDFFGMEIPETVEGKSLIKAINNNEKIRDYALFGVFGCHVNITDGRYTYMRASTSLENEVVYNYTLMPTNIRGFFSPKVLKEATLTTEFPFTNGVPVLKTPGKPMLSSLLYGNLLFDVQNDPKQLSQVKDEKIELEMTNTLCAELEKSEAPSELYTRLGLVKGEKLSAVTKSEPVIFTKKIALDSISQRKFVFLASFLSQKGKVEFLDFVENKIDTAEQVTDDFVKQCLEYVIKEGSLKKREQQIVGILANIERI